MQLLLLVQLGCMDLVVQQRLRAMGRVARASIAQQLRAIPPLCLVLLGHTLSQEGLVPYLAYPVLPELTVTALGRPPPAAVDPVLLGTIAL